MCVHPRGQARGVNRESAPQQPPGCCGARGLPRAAAGGAGLQGGAPRQQQTGERRDRPPNGAVAGPLGPSRPGTRLVVPGEGLDLGPLVVGGVGLARVAVAGDLDAVPHADRDELERHVLLPILLERHPRAPVPAVVPDPQLGALLVRPQPHAPRGLVGRPVAVHRAPRGAVVVRRVVLAPVVAALEAPLAVPLDAAHEHPKRRPGPLVAHHELVLPVVGGADRPVGGDLVGHPAPAPEVGGAALQVILVRLRLPEPQNLLLARERPRKLLPADRVPRPGRLVRDGDVVAVAEDRQLRVLEADRRRDEVLPAVASHSEVDVALPARRLVGEVRLLVLVRRPVEGLALLQVPVGALGLGVVDVDELVEGRVLAVRGVSVHLVGLGAVVHELALIGEGHVGVLGRVAHLPPPPEALLVAVGLERLVHARRLDPVHAAVRHAHGKKLPA
mmetsp:Transcript_44341/g.111021  ORF Transcript_44341/g.111021 Transcript_44341/m.111021 type:complete len:446 (+) Transcript_44341:354-1691(+)